MGKEIWPPRQHPPAGLWLALPCLDCGFDTGGRVGGGCQGLRAAQPLEGLDQRQELAGQTGGWALADLLGSPSRRLISSGRRSLRAASPNRAEGVAGRELGEGKGSKAERHRPEEGGGPR